MRMGYYWDEKDRRRVRFYDNGDSDPASGYNEAAADYIETGDWGWLDPEQNVHLRAYRARYMARCAADAAENEI